MIDAPEAQTETTDVAADTTEAPAAPSIQDAYKDDLPKPEADEPEPDADKPEPDANEADEESEETVEEKPEPIAAPVSWSKDYKDKFEALPRDMQEIIAARETDREKFLQTKSREAAQTRQTVETEARTALQTIMQNHVQQLEPILQQLQPKQPDLSLLNSDDPAARTLYFQQEAAYRNGVAQQTYVQQQLQEAQQHAAAIAQHQQQAEIEAEHEVLNTALGTEWSDPSARAKLLGDLEPIAAELGYPQELIAQARAPDILALRKASEWKAKAAKFDQLNKSKMVPVRAAKALPPTARPGAQIASQQRPVGSLAALYPDDVPRN